MEGFSFSIQYTPERNRFKVLFTPFILLIYFALLLSFGIEKLNISPPTAHPHVQANSQPVPTSPHKVSEQVHHSLQEQLVIQQHHIQMQHAYQNQRYPHTLQIIHHAVYRFTHMPKWAQLATLTLFFSGFMTLITIGFSSLLTLSLPIVLTLLFRKKYPSWWYQWNVHAARFSARLVAFAFFLTPNLPSLEDCTHITLTLPDPKDTSLNRFLPLIKWLLALPHSLILMVLLTLGLLMNIVVYPYVVITARYPKTLFTFLEGVFRWSLRVNCYTVFLCTDTYPKFSFKP